MENKLLKLSSLIFPDLTESDTIESLEELFPERNLPEGAKVTRMAPSPTGFMHIGNLYGALTDERLAHTSGGTFYLRIEDTDDKREVPGAVEKIIKYLAKFGVELPHYSVSQSQEGTKVAIEDVLPGDLIFYSNGKQINHVAIYIGNGQVVHASSPKTGIKISKYNYRTPVKARRILVD